MPGVWSTSISKHLHVCLLNLHVRYLDLQRLYFCYVQRVEAINRFFFYIGGISDRHCLNLVLDHIN
jgi:hypothetical protein